jgi:hypothetical protein
LWDSYGISDGERLFSVILMRLSVASSVFDQEECNRKEPILDHGLELIKKFVIPCFTVPQSLRIIDSLPLQYPMLQLLCLMTSFVKCLRLACVMMKVPACVQPVLCFIEEKQRVNFGP